MYDRILDFMIFCFGLGLFAIITFYVLIGWYVMGKWIIRKIKVKAR